MFNNVALDVVIGLVFIFLLYSLLATIIQELIAHIFHLRARMLVKALRTMLEDRNDKKGNRLVRLVNHLKNNMKHINCPLPENTLTRAFYKHPSIKYLAQSSYKSKPSYIGTENFSSTLIKILRGEDYNGTYPQMNAIDATLFRHGRVSVGQIQNAVIGEETLSQLRQLYIDAQKDIDRFKLLLEKWYDDTMDRVSGWYKRQTQWILILIGFALAAAINIDTIAVYRTLAKDKKAREQIVQMAIEANKQYASIVDTLRKKTRDTSQITSYKTERGDSTVNTITRTITQNPSDTFLLKNYQNLMKESDEAQTVLGLGWSKPNKYQSSGWFIVFLGWLITALAISLGAPFWFDLLNKIVQLRSAGPKPSEAPKTNDAVIVSTSSAKRVG